MAFNCYGFESRILHVNESIAEFILQHDAEDALRIAELDDAKGVVLSLQQQVGALNTSLGVANRQLSANETRINELLARIAELEAGQSSAEFLPAVQFHAVWDRLGSTFGNTHRELLTKLKDAGVKAVRIDTSWRAWEPTKGTLANAHNGKVAATLNWLQQNGMKAIITLNESPEWANSLKELRRLPDDPAFCEYIGRELTAFLSAWGSTVLGVEFWNEPNLTDFDKGGPRPEHYVDCLVAFYKSAKAGRGKGVPIIFGATEAISVAPLTETPNSPRNHFISLAYNRMNSAHNRLRPYDVMAVHCYPGAEDASVASTGKHFWRLRHLDYLFARMDAEGDKSPVYITEAGYSAHSNSTIGTTAQPTWQVGVTEDEQAKLSKSMLDYVKKNYPRVKLLSFYNDWEKGPVSIANYAARHQNGFGWYRYLDRSPKPVASIYKA